MEGVEIPLVRWGWGWSKDDGLLVKFLLWLSKQLASWCGVGVAGKKSSSPDPSEIILHYIHINSLNLFL